MPFLLFTKAGPLRRYGSSSASQLSNRVDPIFRSGLAFTRHGASQADIRLLESVRKGLGLDWFEKATYRGI